MHWECIIFSYSTGLCYHNCKKLQNQRSLKQFFGKNYGHEILYSAVEPLYEM